LSSQQVPSRDTVVLSNPKRISDIAFFSRTRNGYVKLNAEMERSLCGTKKKKKKKEREKKNKKKKSVNQHFCRARALAFACFRKIASLLGGARHRGNVSPSRERITGLPDVRQ